MDREKVTRETLSHLWGVMKDEKRRAAESVPRHRRLRNTKSPETTEGHGLNLRGEISRTLR